SRPRRHSFPTRRSSDLAGVGIAFMVHDLLPMNMPDVFPPSAREPFVAWLRAVVRVADTVVCVSRTVKAELENWLSRSDVESNPRSEEHTSELQSRENLV